MSSSLPLRIPRSHRPIHGLRSCSSRRGLRLTACFSPYSKSELRRMRKDLLVTELKKYDLDTKGTKAQLIDRFQSYFSDQLRSSTPEVKDPLSGRSIKYFSRQSLGWLSEECRKRGISTEGKKADLAQRLRYFIEEEKMNSSVKLKKTVEEMQSLVEESGKQLKETTEKIVKKLTPEEEPEDLYSLVDDIGGLENLKSLTKAKLVEKFGGLVPEVNKRSLKKDLMIQFIVFAYEKGVPMEKKGDPVAGMMLMDQVKLKTAFFKGDIDQSLDYLMGDMRRKYGKHLPVQLDDPVDYLSEEQLEELEKVVAEKAKDSEEEKLLTESLMSGKSELDEVMEMESELEDEEVNVVTGSRHRRSEDGERNEEQKKEALQAFERFMDQTNMDMIMEEDSAVKSENFLKGDEEIVPSSNAIEEESPVSEEQDPVVETSDFLSEESVEDSTDYDLKNETVEEMERYLNMDDVRMKEIGYYDDDEDVNPVVEDNDPVLKESASVVEDKVPVLKEDETDSQEKDPVSVEENDPVLKESASVVEDKVPVLKEDETDSQEKDPVSVEESSIVEDSNPVLKESASVAEDKVPVLKEDETDSQEKDPVSVEENDPVLKESASVAEDKVPVFEEQDPVFLREAAKEILSRYAREELLEISDEAFLGIVKPLNMDIGPARDEFLAKLGNLADEEFANPPISNESLVELSLSTLGDNNPVLEAQQELADELEIPTPSYSDQLEDSVMTEETVELPDFEAQEALMNGQQSTDQSSDLSSMVLSLEKTVEPAEKAQQLEDLNTSKISQVLRELQDQRTDWQSTAERFIEILEEKCEAEQQPTKKAELQEGIERLSKEYEDLKGKVQQKDEDVIHLQSEINSVDDMKTKSPYKDLLKKHSSIAVSLAVGISELWKRIFPSSSTKEENK